jgi:hypothetical protein
MKFLPVILSVLVICAVVMSGCRSPVQVEPYVNENEESVCSSLGKPNDHFPGHYGNPPLQFTKQFKGEIKTLIFKKPGGKYYISFEKRPAGWVCIGSSWLPDGAAF